MTKTQAAQQAQAYADSLRADYYVRVIEMSTRYIVHAHSGLSRIKRTFKFNSEYASYDQGC